MVLVFTPSVRPLWNGRLTAVVTAARSRPGRWGEGVHVRQVGGPGGLGPVLEPGVVSWVWLEQGGEREGQPGEAGHLRACGGQLAEQCFLLAAEGVWPGEREPGDVPGWQVRPVSLGAALGDVAVEQVQAPGVAQVADLGEQAQDRHG